LPLVFQLKIEFPIERSLPSIGQCITEVAQLLWPRLRVQLCKWFTIFQGCIEFDWADEYFQMDTPNLYK
jgi:hypothetical protein